MDIAIQPQTIPQPSKVINIARVHIVDLDSTAENVTIVVLYGSIVAGRFMVVETQKITDKTLFAAIFKVKPPATTQIIGAYILQNIKAWMTANNKWKYPIA